MAELTKRQPLPVLKEWVRACVEEGRNLTSCVPLAEVDFFAQTTMFAERGCVGGCFT